MDTPDFFVGARLGAARIKAGIPLEKAAKDTRIRVQRLREIETDDFSGFTHPTYSRLFLLDYADYLGVPQEDIRPLLPDRPGGVGGGFEYINELARKPSSKVSPPIRRRRRRLGRVLVTLGIVFLVTVGAIYAILTIKKIERVTGSSVFTGKPIPSPTMAPPTPEPTPTPEESPVEQAVPTGDAIPVEQALPPMEPLAEPTRETTPGTPRPTPSL